MSSSGPPDSQRETLASGTNLGVADLFLRRGRQSYVVVFEEGRIVELREVGDDERGRWIDMRAAAKYMNKGYCTLSRTWRKDGLRPRRGSKGYLFERQDLDRLIDRSRLVVRGRTKRIVRCATDA